MRRHVAYPPLLAAAIALAIVGWESGRAMAQPDFPPGQYLARGYFRSPVFTKDGKRLLTTSGSSATGVAPVVQLWDLESGKLVRQFEGHKATVHHLCFSADERRILTAGGNSYIFGPDDPTARVWDVASGKQLLVLDPRRTYVLWAQFAPGGEQILTVSRAQSGPLIDAAVMWDAETGEKRLEVSDVSLYSKPIQMLQPVLLGPRGRFLAGLTADGTRINLWDAKTGAVVWQADGEGKDAEKQGFGALEFSPDGKLLLSACSDNTAQTWRVGMGRGTPLQVFRGHEGMVRAARFCCHGERVMTASRDATARLWETATGRELRRLEHPGPVTEMHVTGDGTRMITRWSHRQRDDQPWTWFGSLWDVSSGREIKRVEYGPEASLGGMTLSPYGRRVLTNLGDGKVLLLDAVTGETIRKYE